MMDDEVILVETLSNKETMFTDRQRKNAVIGKTSSNAHGVSKCKGYS